MPSKWTDADNKRLFSVGLAKQKTHDASLGDANTLKADAHHMTSTVHIPIWARETRRKNEKKIETGCKDKKRQSDPTRYEIRNTLDRLGGIL